MNEKLKEYLESRLKVLNKLLNAECGVVTNDAFEDVRILGQIGEVEAFLKVVNKIENGELCSN